MERGNYARTPGVSGRGGKGEHGIARRVKGFFTRLFYIISIVWKTNPALLFAMTVICVANGVLPVAGAYISRDLLNEISHQMGITAESGSGAAVMQGILFIVVVRGVYMLINRLFTRIGSGVNNVAGELVVNQIKLMILDKAGTLDMQSFDSPEFYERLENANREASQRPVNILNATFTVASSLISAASFITVLFTLGAFVPFVIIAASIPGAVVNYIYRNKSFGYMRRRSRERRRMNYYSSLVVNKDMAKEIRILGLADTMKNRYKAEFKKYYRGLKKLIIEENFWQIMSGLISIAANCALLYYTARSVVTGQFTIGDYSLFSGALTSISSFVSTIVSSTATIYEGTLFIDNMILFMGEKRTVVPSLPEPRIPKRGVSHTVEFRNVSFRYPGTDRDVIRNVDLTLRSGESTVIVGLNGAGKSTLIKLLTRLYDPTEGEILLDGHDIREYDTEALYDMYGIIFQDFGRYAETVGENISFGDIKREGDPDEIAEAAEHGGAADFIGKLPGGYSTPLTRMFEDGGTELSGGQWQKISISRAFYKKSDILIMDEPTAALDPIAEKEVFDRFEELSEGKISVFVSHRLSGAVKAYRILVLENGRIAEMGSHRELMEKRGKYYLLFTTQASRYTSGSEI